MLQVKRLMFDRPEDRALTVIQYVPLRLPGVVLLPPFEPFHEILDPSIFGNTPFQQLLGRVNSTSSFIQFLLFLFRFLVHLGLSIRLAVAPAVRPVFLTA